jgi:hypothetical protein
VSQDSLLARECRTLILSVSEGSSKQAILHFVQEDGEGGLMELRLPE